LRRTSERDGSEAAGRERREVKEALNFGNHDRSIFSDIVPRE
jgi:hypothetical protein